MRDDIDLSTLPYIGECEIPVRWTDLDTYAHVNNAVYFSYLNDGRTRVLHNSIRPVDTIQYFMVDARCVYLKPIDYPNTLKLKHYLKDIGNTSFTVLCDIYSQDESKHFARTYCKLVCVDAATQKPMRIPDFLREKLHAS